jgi:hypothetical protein
MTNRLHIYQNCLRAIEAEFDHLSADYPDGAVIGRFNNRSQQVDLLVFGSLQEGEKYWAENLSDEERSRSPILPITAGVALVL